MISSANLLEFSDPEIPKITGQVLYKLQFVAKQFSLSIIDRHFVLVENVLLKLRHLDLSLTIHKAYQEVLKKVSKIVFKLDI